MNAYKIIKKAIGVLVIAFFIWTVYFIFSIFIIYNGAKIFIDGEFIGIVSMSNILGAEEYIEIHVKNRIQNKINSIIQINSEISVQAGRFARDDMYSFNWMMNKIENEINYYIYGAAIFKNEIPFLYFASLSSADDFLDYIKKNIIIDNAYHYEFANNIHIRNYLVLPSYIKSFYDSYNFVMNGRYIIFDYIVTPGDNLSIIAERIEIGLSVLLSQNPNININSILREGDILNFKRNIPLIYIYSTKIIEGEYIRFLNQYRLWD